MSKQSTQVTFFDGKRSFADVPITDAGISTTEFLEASEALVMLFDVIGGTAFSLVKSDMRTNIKKIRDRQLGHLEQSATLQILVEHENATEKKRVATEGFLWLARGLQFTAAGLRKNIDDKQQELGVSFSKAYEETLRKHHGMLVRPLISVALKSTPYRKDFYKKLGQDQDLVEKQLIEWLNALENIVSIVMKYFEDNKVYTKGM
ncbi:putative protein PLEKHA9 [Neolecta irregularis DAH-3]|uniref:Glycolipid transfer protein domain-containing protein n=1 Tax=Neolecta irregularis (strain DAH-3) TaxID=1198029 RepID=A0A1U7LWS8_NEOID|nr:putative protein PLEKHA9 [Neolecta irregularis DAH-3]|eukprot:OLL27127.1 putative protein PLEKHA9 [Neolecta irregularis DAH-3]